MTLPHKGIQSLLFYIGSVSFCVTEGFVVLYRPTSSSSISPIPSTPQIEEGYSSLNGKINDKSASRPGVTTTQSLSTSLDVSTSATEEGNEDYDAAASSSDAISQGKPILVEDTI